MKTAVFTTACYHFYKNIFKYTEHPLPYTFVYLWKDKQHQHPGNTACFGGRETDYSLGAEIGERIIFHNIIVFHVYLLLEKK